MKINFEKPGFCESYSDYYSLILRTFYSKLGDEELSQELTQEVFSRFYENFEKVEKPRHWLLGTLKNVLSNYFRQKEKRNKEVDVDNFFDVAFGYANGFRDTRIILKEAIDDLEDEKDRILVDLVAIGHYSYTEAGKELGMSKQQVYTRYNQILIRIKDFLAKKGINSLEELL